MIIEQQIVAGDAGQPSAIDASEGDSQIDAQDASTAADAEPDADAGVAACMPVPPGDGGASCIEDTSSVCADSGCAAPFGFICSDYLAPAGATGCARLADGQNGLTCCPLATCVRFPAEDGETCNVPGLGRRLFLCPFDDAGRVEFPDAGLCMQRAGNRVCCP